MKVNESAPFQNYLFIIDYCMRFAFVSLDGSHCKPVLEDVFMSKSLSHLKPLIKHDFVLTHWGGATNVCVSKLTIIGSDNGLSPGRGEAIIWTNDGILFIGPLGINFSKIVIKICIFFISENAFENVVRKSATILSRRKCVKSGCCSSHTVLLPLL